MRFSRWIAVGLMALALGGCGGCGKDDREAVGRAPVGAPGEDVPRDLQPLPEAPELQIEQEPGSNGAFTVVAARPQGEFEGEIRPTVTFSKPVKSLAMVEEQQKEDAAAPIARIEPPLEGEWRWLGSASAEFVPRTQAPYSTPFKVIVAKGLKALDGSVLAEDYSFEFSTPRPKLQEASPASGFRWLRPEQTVKVLFNQPVDEAALARAASFLVTGESAPWPVKVVSSVSIADERRKQEEAAKGENRHYPRSDPSERGFMNQQHRYELAPSKPFPTGQQVTLRIADSLAGKQGPLTLGSDVELKFTTYGAPEIVAIRFCSPDVDRCPYGPLVLLTSNPIDVKSVKGKVKIEPAVELDWDRMESWSPNASYDDGSSLPYVAIPGRFRPGTDYQVTIAAGLADEFTQTISTPKNARVRTSDLEPALNVGSSLALIEAASGPRLPVDVTNLRTLEVTMWQPTIAELIGAVAAPYEQQFIPRAPEVREDRPLSYTRNQHLTHPLDLSPVLGGKKTGFAAVLLNSPDLQYRPDRGHRVIAQVTDLAAHLKTGPAKSLVFVTRLSTGEPVPDAQVELFDRTARMVWQGQTNADGLADMPGAVELGFASRSYAWEAPFVLAKVSSGEDQTFTANTWSEGVGPWDFGVSAGWEGETPQSTGVLFADRGIYRPGDKVFLKGIARFRQVGALKAPEAGSVLKVVVKNSRDQEVQASEVKVTRYGTFSAEALIPKDAPTGYYGVTATGDTKGGTLNFNGSFRVEEYRAPQFKVEVELTKPELVQGEALEGQVFARYLFGGAMNDAQVKWSAHSTSTEFTPVGYEAFSFGQETWWWDDGQPQPSGGFFASGEGRVDGKGAFAIKAGAVQAQGQKTWTYTVEAEVTDVNRQTVAGRKSVTVHPAALYVGLRLPTGFPETGKEFAIDSVVVDPQGKRVSGRKLELEFQRRSWKSVRQKDASGGFQTVSEPVEEVVHTCPLQSEDAPVACRYTAKEPGFYIVRASVADDQGRKHTASRGVYVVGQGWVAWQRDDTDRVELLADRTLYNVGDTAKVLVKSPYPEALALVTVEREGVIERRREKLVGSVRTLEIPITDAMVPNIYVSVLLVRPRVAQGGIETGDDPGRPAVRVGLVKLNVERKTRRLDVAVTTDRPSYQPGQEVTANIAVTNHLKQGEQAEVTLYVVDEAVLRLTAYTTPDPISAIYPERPLSVRLGEPLLHLVRRRHYGEKGEEQGGGGGDAEGAGFRSNFQTTVVFNPTLETDAAGKAQVKFKLPDNLTTFRVMAVAVTPVERFGSGETSFQVNKPLLTLPALPRFARVGDTFEAGVVIHSYEGGNGMVTVTAAVEGGAKLVGTAEGKTEVPQGSPRELRFKFAGTAAGNATFRFKATRGADSDGVQVTIPIEAPISPEAVAAYGDTRDQSIEGLVPPKDVWEGVGGLDVTLTSTAMGNFQQGMRQLVEYPYGCLEQQASRLIPFVALREIAPQFGVAWQGPGKKQKESLAELNQLFRTFLFDPLDTSKMEDPDQVVAATISSIERLQMDDGAFRYWPDSQCGTAWTSAWATLALGRAKDVGYAVNPEVLNRAQKFVAGVAGGKCGPCQVRCSEEDRAMAVYVLARTKSPKPSYYGQLYANRAKLSLFSRALLADAMFVGGGDRAQAKVLLQELLNHGKESAAGLHFEEVQSGTYAAMWQSDTRTTGAILQTLTDVMPEHPFVGKIARYLTGVRRGDGTWRSTQEAAFSLMGLTEVLRTKEKETPEFVARVKLGENLLVEEKFSGRSMKVKSQSLGITEVAQKASGGAKLAFTKEGTGVLYYSALLKYAPKQMPKDPIDRGLFVQRWFEPYAGGGQATQFYAGDLVRVRLRVASNQERHYAAFEIPLPAGLEPVDTSLATTAAQPMSAEEEGSEEGYEYESDEDQTSGSADGEDNPWAFSFWSPFTHIERRDAKVVVFADHLPPGIHVTSFVARATTPGQFILAPARGELMYEPEVFGRSGGGMFEVVIPPQLSQR